MHRRIFTAYPPFLPRTLAGVALLCLVMASLPACANYDPAPEDFAWQGYSLHRERYSQDRERLAQVIQEVLFHRGYTFREGRVENLATPGENGYLETEWNDSEARPPMYQSYEGFRRRLHLEIREDIENVLPRDQEAQERYRYILLEAVEAGQRTIALGVAVAEEVNTRMNVRPGDYENADWQWRGFSEEQAGAVQSEIAQLFNARDPDRYQEGDMSDRSRHAYESAGAQSSTPVNPNGTPTGEGGIFGPQRGDPNDDIFRDLREP